MGSENSPQLNAAFATLLRALPSMRGGLLLETSTRDLYSRPLLETSTRDLLLQTSRDLLELDTRRDEKSRRHVVTRDRADQLDDLIER